MKSRGRVMVPVPANADSGIQGPANPTPCTFPIVLLFGLFLTLLHPLIIAILPCDNPIQLSTLLSKRVSIATPELRSFRASEVSCVNGRGFNFDVAPSLVGIWCPLIYKVGDVGDVGGSE